jgi:hypothetical protein
VSSSDAWCDNNYCSDHESIFSLDLILKMSNQIKKDFEILQNFLNIEDCKLVPQIIGSGGRG